MPLSVLQAKSEGSNNTTGTTLAVSPTSATTAGSLLVALVTIVTGVGQVVSVTDSASQAWTVVASESFFDSNIGADVLTAVAYFADAASVTSVTATVGIGNTVGVFFYEVGSALTVSPLDQTGTAGTLSGTPSVSASGATSQADEIVFAALCSYDFGSAGDTLSQTGWTFDDSWNTTAYGYAGYELLSATGTPSCAPSGTSAGCYAGALATFKAASVSVAVNPVVMII